ncbi:type 2 DNA topoisomerase 6 subunit B-like isoform X2 [Archocentrus centrarchus]|uniref:type 2 DNA topoisomerase 6 subunit B-like isoform X2 n=1 Tax=Archocentrus centrarchus TaxID=63155 RepID=UPI0011E9EC0C|nr:type 2 DNA topoisomerase 6 subunit B-like isoform X2 [Archocentrus centrarchus]
MVMEMQQVLRLIMQMAKQRQQLGLRTAGGLLVLLWTDTGASTQKINCTVAAAGPWCTGIQIEALQLVLADLKDSMFPCVWPHHEPDPEELSAFTDLYGSLRLLLSFQVKDTSHCSSEWQARIEAFLRTFTVANAGIQIHLKFKIKQQTSQREFRVKFKRKVALADLLLTLDVACSAPPLWCVKKGCWCERGHPAFGGRLPLSIPPQAMDQGLLGDLSVQLVTLLSPCVLPYPNVATELTRIQNTSNIPVTGPSGFFQTLPAALDCQEMGLDRIYCSTFKDLVYSGGTVYTVEKDSWDNPEQESSLPTVQQSLLLFFFLQHSDPFTSQLTDLMATEVLIEHHLEDILNKNRQAVTAALQAELRNTLKVQHHRKKQQEKLHAAAEVILSSSISIVSSSSSMDFRNACLNCMKVHDTRELGASLRESLWRVMSWKFIPRARCFSAKMEVHPENDDPTTAEI